MRNSREEGCDWIVGPELHFDELRYWPTPVALVAIGGCVVAGKSTPCDDLGQLVNPVDLRLVRLGQMCDTELRPRPIAVKLSTSVRLVPSGGSRSSGSVTACMLTASPANQRDSPSTK